MAEQEVVVTIAEPYLDQPEKVLRRCRKAGLTVTLYLKTLGVIQGTIDPHKIAALAEVAGVAAVEQSRRVDIPPPESEIQ